MSAEQMKVESLIGQTIGGRFVTTKLLGEGGMGYVFKAIQQPSKREVALKILKEDYMSDDTIRERFLREAEVIAQLTHPNIVTLFDSGLEERNNVLYMAMEFLQGSELSDVINNHIEEFTLERVLKVSTQISAALGAAHQNGIIHRDLKPENVFLVKDHEGLETVKVLDFGFARLQSSAKKLTQFGVAFGTPHYMSPEQAMGQLDITAAADVYAVGVMLFEMVSGEVPYNGKNAMEIMTKQVNAPIPPLKSRPGLNAPPALLKLIEHCMNKDPKQRPQNGDILMESLQKIANGESPSSDANNISLDPNSLPAPGKDGGGLQQKQMILFGGIVLVVVILTVVLTLLFTG